MNLKKKNGDYWKYGDIYVPIEILSIPALDRVNTVSLLLHNSEHHIVKTALDSLRPEYTKEEYLEKYCKYDEENDRWIYVGNKE